MKKIILLSILVLGVITPRAQSIYDTLTLNEKIEGISKFWKEAAYNFVFFDKVTINWDSAYQAYLPKALAAKNIFEYYQTLNEFAGLLKDGHTYINKTDYFYKEIGGFPLTWTLVGKQRFVSAIDERLVNEIPIGAEVLSINNLKVDSFLRQRNTIFKNSIYEFRFKINDDKIITKQITGIAGKDRINYVPATANGWIDFEHKAIPQDLYYVKINTFGDSMIPQKFINILPEIYKSKGLIIDIRENGGGNSYYARRIAEYLVSNPYTVGSAWSSRLNNSAKRAHGSVSIYGMKPENEEDKIYFEDKAFEYNPGDTVFISPAIKKVTIPVVVLIGGSTFSAAEDFLIFLDKSKNITLIGNYTYGSSGQPLIIKLPKGLSANICSKRDTYPDGREFIGIGIKPDVLVTKNKEDYFNKRDTELEVAIEYLKKGRR